MTRFQQARLVELAPYVAAEDTWGEHPECPVEVLVDGSQVWRVPEGSEVHHRDPRFSNLRVVTIQRQASALDSRGPEYIWVATPREQFEVHWTRLRRIGYTPRAPRVEAEQTSHASR